MFKKFFKKKEKISDNKNILIAADNLAKTYAININNGKILWSKKNKTSFNSEIKIYDKNFFVVDTSNNLHSFSTQTGKKNWSYITEKSFVNSFKTHNSDLNIIGNFPI